MLVLVIMIGYPHFIPLAARILQFGWDSFQ